MVLLRTLLTSLLTVALLLFPSIVQAKARDRLNEAREDKTSGLGFGTSKEEIYANRDRRKRQLKSLVNDMRKQLADHASGEKVLSLEEKLTLEKRIDIYSRKLDTMTGEIDERVRTEYSMRDPFV